MKTPNRAFRVLAEMDGFRLEELPLFHGVLTFALIIPK